MRYEAPRRPQAISFSAPTGAGKTIMMAALFEQILFGAPGFDAQPDAAIVWLSDMPELNEQTRLKIEGKSDRVRVHRMRHHRFGVRRRTPRWRLRLLRQHTEARNRQAAHVTGRWAPVHYLADLRQHGSRGAGSLLRRHRRGASRRAHDGQQQAGANDHAALHPWRPRGGHGGVPDGHRAQRDAAALRCAAERCHESDPSHGHGIARAGARFGVAQAPRADPSPSGSDRRRVVAAGRLGSPLDGDGPPLG